MKLCTFLLFASLGFLLQVALPPAASAAEPDPAARTLWTNTLIVIDKDPKGTNLRDAPSGKVLKVLPKASPQKPHLVSPVEAKNGWFRVTVNGASGWMHSSVLGTCSEATEDGAPRLHKNPADDGGQYTSPELPYGSRLTPLDIRTQSDHGWLKVRYVDARGKAYEGWLMNHVTAAEGSLQDECAAAWAGRK